MGRGRVARTSPCACGECTNALFCPPPPVYKVSHLLWVGFILICPAGRVGQTVEHSKAESTQPNLLLDLDTLYFIFVHRGMTNEAPLSSAAYLPRGWRVVAALRIFSAHYPLRRCECDAATRLLHSQFVCTDCNDDAVWWSIRICPRSSLTFKMKLIWILNDTNGVSFVWEFDIETPIPARLSLCPFRALHIISVLCASAGSDAA